MTQLTKVKEELATLKRRLEQVQNLQWIRRYGSEEMNQLIYHDVPKLIEEFEKVLNDAHNNDIKTRVKSRRKTRV